MALEFRRALRVAGVLTNADTTPTISLVNVDTGATVVATTTTGVSNPSTGRYSYTVALPTEGVNYRATWTITVGGQVIASSSDQIAPDSDAPVTAAGEYADYDDLVDRHGEKNIAQWSNLDSDDTDPDYDRIQTAFDDTDAYIHSLVGGQFVTPLAGHSTVDSAILKKVSVGLVTEQLYHARGQRDDQLDNKMAEDYEKAENLLGQIQTKAIPLSATRLYPTSPTSPITV